MFSNLPKDNPQGHPPSRIIFFNRPELNLLLRAYGRGVASGDWRDYAIDGLADCAVFSIFKRCGEHPLFWIEKRPELARRQGAYAIHGSDGRTLRRGADLAQVLRFFERPRLDVID